MGYGLVTTDGPDEEPVTLDEAKAHLVVDHADDDDLVTRLVAAARHQTEVECGRRWVTQTLVMTLADFPRDTREVGGRCVVGPVWLPVEPVSEVAEVRYYDGNGVLQILGAADYLAWLAHSPPVLYPAPGKLWPLTQVGRLGAAEIEFAAGYADTNLVPAAAKQAILLAVGFWYENRGDAEDPTQRGLPEASLRLCRSLSTGAYT